MNTASNKRRNAWNLPFVQKIDFLYRLLYRRIISFQVRSDVSHPKNIIGWITFFVIES